MRLISQNGCYDYPYEQCAVYRDENKIMCRLIGDEKAKVFAEYWSKEKAEKTLELLHRTYTGIFITNAEIPSDSFEELREMMKTGFGCVRIKESDDRTVEFNPLNICFTFPKDEEVEI